MRSRVMFLSVGLMCGACSWFGGGIPAEVRDAVFNDARFIEPISIDLPKDMSVEAQKGYEQALRTSFLPPIPPSGVDAISPPELKDLVQRLGFVEVIELPNRTSAQPIRAFRYTTKFQPYAKPGNWGPRLTLANRKLVSIDFSNRYRANPMGTGEREIAALRFSYDYEVAATKAVLKMEREGEAKAELSPDTGRWKLTELTLDDADVIDVVRGILTSAPGASSNASSTPSFSQADLELARKLEKKNLEERFAGNEATAIDVLRQLNAGEQGFSSECAGGFYAGSFRVLGTPGSAGKEYWPAYLVPSGGSEVVSKSGYSFEVSMGVSEPSMRLMSGRPEEVVTSKDATCNGFPAGVAVAAYKAIAYPVNESAGRRFFTTDVLGTIYFGTSKTGPWEVLR